MQFSGFNLEQAFCDNIGPKMFRLVWWNHLDPSKRNSFSEDLFELITIGVVKSLELSNDIRLPDAARHLAAQKIRIAVESRLGSFHDKIAEFSDQTFEKVTGNLRENRNESEFNIQFAMQLNTFTSRIANCSDELIDAVRIINEEFIIWLKTHVDQTAKINQDAFEQLAGEILASHGFEIEFTGRIKNKSADLIAISSDIKGQKAKHLVECKRYSENTKIGLRIVNAVIGASFRAKTQHAMLITTRLCQKTRIVLTNRKMRNFVFRFLFYKDGLSWHGIA